MFTTMYCLFVEENAEKMDTGPPADSKKGKAQLLLLNVQMSSMFMLLYFL